MKLKRETFWDLRSKWFAEIDSLENYLYKIILPEKEFRYYRWKLCPLSSLEVGFNPELTGRENVYMNGAMLGFSAAEIDAMYDDISRALLSCMNS